MDFAEKKKKSFALDPQGKREFWFFFGSCSKSFG